MQQKLAIFGGPPHRQAPFHHWPVYDTEEESSLLGIVRATRWAVGRRTGVIDRFEREFARYHSASSAVSCTNCTHALEIILSASGIGAGDEVIVPAYTFIATASAPARIGAIPIFADINEETLLIDPTSVESLITSKTKAIIPVHFAGQMADMEAIQRIAREHELLLIEDAAQAHGARRSGHSPGHYAPATFSFQYSKNMTAGEGGIIIANDASLIARCKEHIWHGRKEGGVWYEHFETTSNYRMTEWSAAVLLAQLQRLPEQNKRREENAEHLTELLQKDDILRPTRVDEEVEVHARHLFPVRLNQEVLGGLPKEKVLEALAAEGLPFLSGYKFPLYKNPCFQEGKWGIRGQRYQEAYDYTKVNLPGAEAACRNTLWIHHSVLLGNKSDMQDIALGTRKLMEGIKELREWFPQRV